MKLGNLKGIAVRIKALTFSMINKYNARDNINFTTQGLQTNVSNFNTTQKYIKEKVNGLIYYVVDVIHNYHVNCKIRMPFKKVDI